jgi:hypothetical protein
MKQEELNKIIRAFLMLTAALEKHKHEYTEEELRIYDEAVVAVFQDALLRA